MPTIAFLGDLMLGRGVSRELALHPPEWVWGDVLPVLHKADAVIANLETPITKYDQPWREVWKWEHFRADPAVVKSLRTAGVTLLNLANNHTMDFGHFGLRDTLTHLQRANIKTVGAGHDAIAASLPALFDIGGIKVGVVGATDGMPEFAASAERPGTNVVEFETPEGALSAVRPAVASLRSQGAALIVLSVHWGPNMRVTPRARIKHFAHAAMAAGIDVIHGHSAHVVHGVEARGPGVILYDTGDFVSDYWKFPFRRNKWSFIFLVDFGASGPTMLRLVPVHLQRARVELARGAAFDAICRRMIRVSAELGAKLDETRDGLVLRIKGVVH